MCRDIIRIAFKQLQKNFYKINGHGISNSKNDIIRVTKTCHEALHNRLTLATPLDYEKSSENSRFRESENER